MFDEIKNNWGKAVAGIAILIAVVSIGYYFIIYAPEVQKNNLLNEKNCAEASKKFFDEFFIEGNFRGEFDGYISHYNKSLEKCFIKFSNKVGEDGIYYSIGDPINNTEYGEIKWTIPDENDADWCMLWPDGETPGAFPTKSCDSKAEFDKFTEPYMKN